MRATKRIVRASVADAAQIEVLKRERGTLLARNALLVEALELAQATIGRLAGCARGPFSSVAGTQGVISAAIASGRASQ